MEEEQSGDRLVICSCSVGVCDQQCPHKYPHLKLYDCYTFNRSGEPERKYCTDVDSECGWQGEWCHCNSVEGEKT
jgi:hypothetical protein